MLDTCSARLIAAHNEFFDISNPSWKGMVTSTSTFNALRVNVIFMSWCFLRVAFLSRIRCAN
jgi:hypothetical protein